MLRIYGASDDLVEFRGVKRDEVDCWDQDVEVCVTAPNGEGIKVTMTHGYTWQATLQQYPAEDGTEFPWPVAVKTLDQLEDTEGYEPDYSVFVEIDCGENAEIEITKKDRDD